jgi:Pvc16 N-terminal domain
MPLLDLSLATKTLTNVIEQVLKASPEAPKYTPLSVTTLPPDKLTGEHTLGLYLYHAEEHPTFKNAPPAGLDMPAVRFTPLGLNLYYQLTAHSEIADTGAEMEQLMMGMAMKAMHDYASIDDQTQVGAFTVFPPELRGNGNIFRVVLQPVQASEAPNYWTAGSQPLRFAAYYQVSVAFLEPEQATSHSLRVLGFGAFSFARGNPFLDTSENTIVFTVPGEPSPRSVVAQPAQAPVGGKFVLTGGGLSGNPTTLLIRNSRFPAAIEVGPEWGVSATDTQITAVVQPKAGLFTVLPGVYTATAKVSLQRPGADNKLQSFGNTSNQMPFLVSPRITATATAADIVTVTGGVFQDAAITAADVQVIVGTTTLQPKTGATLTPGQFETVNPSTLRFEWPASGFNTGDVVPLRILINGVENAPVWVVAP